MGWSTEFDELLTDTVVVYPPSSLSYHGVQTFSTAGSTYLGRYVRKAEQVRNADGHVVEQSGVVWVKSTAALSTGGKITVNGAAHPILGVDRFPDEDGLHHQRVRLGW